MRFSGQRQALLFAAAACAFFFNLGGARLWDDDEPKNAQCAREMLDRGDWLIPSFNGDLRTDKPVLVYWLMMSAYRTFGVGEFAARFWSAAAALGTTLLTYHIGRILLGPRVGFWSGWILATTLMFVVAARAATPDSVMIFCATLALFFFVRGAWGASGTLAGANQVADYLPRRTTDLPLAYGAMALGVLAKGPVAAVLPLLVLVSYVVIVRQCLCSSQSASRLGRLLRFLSPAAWLSAGWRLRPFTALAVIAAIAGPWYLLVGIATDGEWLTDFLGIHNLTRYWRPMEGHQGPIWYYLPAVLFGFFPWSIVLPQAVARTVVQIRRSTNWAAYLFLACWAGAWIGFFSLSGTKLPSYVTPAFPALAMLTAAWIDGWLTEPQKLNRWLLRQGLVSLGLVGIALMIALPILDHYVLPGEAILGLIGLPLVIGSLAALIWAFRAPRQAALALAGSALAFVTLTFSFAAVRVSRHQNSVALPDALHGDSRFEPAAFDLAVPGMVYYAHRRIPHYEEARYALRFLRSSPEALLVTHSRGYRELRSRLPPDVAIVSRQRRFLRRSEVVVLGRQNALAQRAAQNR